MSRLLKQSGHTRWMFFPPCFIYPHHAFWQIGQRQSPSTSTAVSRVHADEHTPTQSHGSASISASLAAVCTQKFPFANILLQMCMCSPPPTARPTCVGVRTHTFPLSSTCDLAVIPASPRPATLPPLLTVKRIMKQKKGQARQTIVLFIMAASLFQRKLDIS